MVKGKALYAVFFIALFTILSGCSGGEDSDVIASKRAKVEELEIPLQEEVIVDAESGEVSEAPVEEKAVVAEKPVPEEKKAPEKPPEKTQAASREKAPAETKTVKKPEAAGERVWVINVASLTDQADAFKLKSSLSDQGFKSYVTVLKKNGKVWHRVRVGFYPSREEAARIGEKIARLNRNVKDPWVTKAEAKELKYR